MERSIFSDLPHEILCIIFQKFYEKIDKSKYDKKMLFFIQINHDLRCRFWKLFMYNYFLNWYNGNMINKNMQLQKEFYKYIFSNSGNINEASIIFRNFGAQDLFINNLIDEKSFRLKFIDSEIYYLEYFYRLYHDKQKFFEYIDKILSSVTYEEYDHEKSMETVLNTSYILGRCENTDQMLCMTNDRNYYIKLNNKFDSQKKFLEFLCYVICSKDVYFYDTTPAESVSKMEIVVLLDHKYKIFENMSRCYIPSFLGFTSYSSKHCNSRLLISLKEKLPIQRN